MSNFLKGGKGDKLSKKDVDPVQLKMGIKVEMEHASDPRKAAEIALDHLSEDPKYYSKLKAAGLADELDESSQASQDLEKISIQYKPNFSPFKTLKFVRCGGKNFKKNAYYRSSKNTGHQPPEMHGFYAFPENYVERFLVVNPGDCGVFNYSGLLWTYLTVALPKDAKIYDRKNGWVLVSTDTYEKILTKYNALKNVDAAKNYTDYGKKTKTDPSRRSGHRIFSKDNYEVFIPEKNFHRRSELSEENNSHVTFIEATKQDLPGLMKVDHEVFEFPYSQNTWNKFFIDTKKHVVMKMVDGDNICGFMIMDKYPEHLLFNKMGIDKAHRRQGLGERAMYYVDDYARKSGYDTVLGHVRHNNIASLAMHKKTGSDCQETDGTYQNGDKVIRCVRNLKKKNNQLSEMILEAVNVALNKFSR